MKSIYLDHAAATPLDPAVLQVMEPYFAEKFYNPSATYLAAREVHKNIEAARAQVAKLTGVRPAEVVFTAGGTEANNLAIRGVMEQFPEANVAVSAIEHDSVLNPARQYKHTIIPVLPISGLVDPAAISTYIDDQTVLVSIMLANNEIGTIQAISAIATELDKIRAARQKTGNTLPLYVHTDACQAANYLNLQLRRSVDMMTLNGGKIYGPKQSGALIVASHVQFKPQILGGGQEYGKRSGTENVAGIIGFAEALTLAQATCDQEFDRLKELQTLACELIVEKIPGAIINGSEHRAVLGQDVSDKVRRRALTAGHRLPNNIHVTFPGIDNERLMMQLDGDGVICAVGSACSASNEEPSHVLKAVGLSDEDAQSSLRFTMGRSTDKTAIRELVKRLVAATKA